jgi:hypothetical protein
MSDSRCRGVSPAQQASWPAVLNRVTSPISATITAARTGPMPGSSWIARQPRWPASRSAMTSPSMVISVVSSPISWRSEVTFPA